MIEKVLGLTEIENLYKKACQLSTSENFLTILLKEIGVKIEVFQVENLKKIPTEGPVLIVANHPVGAIEGIVLAKEILEVRPDLQILANQLLKKIPALEDLFIGVDVLSKNAALNNMMGIKKVHCHLENNGALLLFPAGLVSNYQFKQKRIVDPPWNRILGQLIRRYQCTSLPVWVEGRNSILFHLAGCIHPRLRTAFLAMEVLNKNGKKLSITFGSPIPAKELMPFSDYQAITDYVRISTEALSPCNKRKPQRKKTSIHPIAAPSSVEDLCKEVATLKEDRLLQHNEFEVYCSPYEKLHAVMHEIAVNREIAFREVGLGTGFSKDSDHLDPHYRHLFLWDTQKHKIPGAYRLCFTDEIVARYGVEGLYSRSLYRYNETFIQRLGKSIELGRSFIHPSYQRLPIALNLLWQGIGQLIVKNPQYHTVFGSVNVSQRYSDLTRSLIADTLLQNFKTDEFEGLVTPLTPHKTQNRVWSKEIVSEMSNVKLLNTLIGRCHPTKALPVLIRHYLSLLSGKMVCFTMHTHFNNSLDGLIIVDSRKSKPRTLKHFMGSEGYKTFKEFHKLPEENTLREPSSI